MNPFMILLILKGIEPIDLNKKLSTRELVFFWIGFLIVFAGMMSVFAFIIHGSRNDLGWVSYVIAFILSSMLSFLGGMIGLFLSLIAGIKP